ncbi:hypothetical protein BB559_003773 [Furculomyces boomerangus]|uniref:HMG box domain-containing protein n=2 Tax=Harpellales TaxID=61421 RepID=A0A2T9Y206_9FUNG|nr:hypothetical protein BB559_006544 [Furculomyces boomerangus]PVU92273.1 hypothetical protein BB559_003773 [Furculomyces boomerangus]PWA00640.1 hypothetical protein BB558_003306 [Smittium angustum]
MTTQVADHKNFKSSKHPMYPEKNTPGPTDSSKQHFPRDNDLSSVDMDRLYENSSQTSRVRKLKRQLDELEDYNDRLAVKLFKWQKKLRRLKIERNILFERLEKTSKFNNSLPNSESESDIPLKEAYVIHQHDSDSDSIIPLSVLAEEKHSIDHNDLLSQKQPPLDLLNSQKRSKVHKKNDDDIDVGREINDEEEFGTVDHALERRKKPERDPNAPKRPANAFVMYCQDERTNIKLNSSESTNSEISKQISLKWKELPIDEKQRYYNKYEEMKNQYKLEMSHYKEGTQSRNTETPGNSQTGTSFSPNTVDLESDPRNPFPSKLAEPNTQHHYPEIEEDHEYDQPISSSLRKVLSKTSLNASPDQRPESYQHTDYRDNRNDFYGSKANSMQSGTANNGDFTDQRSFNNKIRDRNSNPGIISGGSPDVHYNNDDMYDNNQFSPRNHINDHDLQSGDINISDSSENNEIPSNISSPKNK